MKQVLMWSIVILALAGLLALASARADDARANRIDAQARLVGAQSSARQDLLVGLMPYALLGLVTITGGTITIVALTWPRPTPPAQTQIIERRIIERRIIERQMVILIQPGQSRRKVYQVLGRGRE